MKPEKTVDTLEKAFQTLDLSSYRYDTQKQCFVDAHTEHSDVYKMRDVTNIISFLDSHNLRYEVDEERNIRICP